MSTNDEYIITHLENLKSDARDEIKQRIKQRDEYSVQLIVALGVIIGLAFANTNFRFLVLLAPPISAYFTVLIMYSYQIHESLTKYIREIIEPTLNRLCKTNTSLITSNIKFEPEDEIQQYFKFYNWGGLRRNFFFQVSIIILIMSDAYYIFRLQHTTYQFIGVFAETVISIWFIRHAFNIMRKIREIKETSIENIKKGALTKEDKNFKTILKNCCSKLKRRSNES